MELQTGKHGYGIGVSDIHLLDDNDDDCSTVVSSIIVPTSFKSNDSCLKFIQYVAGYYRR
ncbi:hypothetical protein HanIR_Chr09g0444721 [Helianthus annuus]|nr:hypothetical protein HanIR_Chr09g0444721 [Helianthus annuus]